MWLRSPLAGTIVFLAGMAMALFRMGGVGRVAESPGAPRWTHTDFYSSYYYPVMAFLNGENPHDRAWFMSHYPVNDPYGPFFPINFVVHSPFTLLPPASAANLYFLCSVLLSLAVAYLALRLGGLQVTRARVLTVAGILLLSRPGHWTLLLGQASILLTVVTYLAILCARSTPALGGAALAVSVFKPTFGLPLGALLLARKQVRVVAVGGLLSVVVNLPLLGIMVAREGGLAHFVQVLDKGLQESQQAVNAGPASSAFRVDAPAFLSRIVGYTPSAATQLALTGGALVIGMAALFRLTRSPGRASDDLSIAIICLSVLLFGSHLGYDAVLLTAPLVILLFRGLPQPAGPALRWVFLTLYAVPALNWAASESVIAALEPSRTAWLLIASASGFCVLALFSGYVWLAFRVSERVPASLPGVKGPPLHQPLVS